VFYLRERNEFGCDRDPCTCRRHLRYPDLDDAPDARLLPRLRHILRVEGMITVGCKFGPDDLEWGQWQDLMVVHQERHWVQEQARALRDTIRDETREANAGMAEVRQAAGIPGPGQSLFGGKKR